MEGREREHIWRGGGRGDYCGCHKIHNSRQLSMIGHPSQRRNTFHLLKLKVTNKH